MLLTEEISAIKGLSRSYWDEYLHSVYINKQKKISAACSSLFLAIKGLSQLVVTAQHLCIDLLSSVVRYHWEVSWVNLYFHYEIKEDNYYYQILWESLKWLDQFWRDFHKIADDINSSLVYFFIRLAVPRSFTLDEAQISTWHTNRLKDFYQFLESVLFLISYQSYIAKRGRLHTHTSSSISHTAFNGLLLDTLNK